MVATGVSIFMSPVFAILPATNISKVNADPAIRSGPNHIFLVDEITNFRLAGLTGEIRLNDHRIHMFNCDRTRGGYNFSNGV